MKNHVLLLFLIIHSAVYGQMKWNSAYQQYIDQYKDLAINTIELSITVVLKLNCNIYGFLRSTRILRIKIVVKHQGIVSGTLSSCFSIDKIINTTPYNNSLLGLIFPSLTHSYSQGGSDNILPHSLQVLSLKCFV